MAYKLSPFAETDKKPSLQTSGTSFFFSKQKTAYEITYGDWSSDVCSSDLARDEWVHGRPVDMGALAGQLRVSRARSEERRVGKECRRLCRSRRSPEQ